MFSEYRPQQGFDEYFSDCDQPRSGLSPLLSSLGRMGLEQLNHNHSAASMLLKRLGATFRLNDSGSQGVERILPFDPLPRLIRASEWQRLEKGLFQRLEAIDLFLADVYGPGRIMEDGIVPREDVLSSQGWRPQMQGVTPPLGRWCHISGLDLVRDGTGTWRVLEDNLRCPSGVAYFLENRRVMKRIFPSLFDGRTVHPIDNYASNLLQTLRELAPWTDTPKVVLLSPGVYNSAYFEHSYLAQQMGIELVEGKDLFVKNEQVFMRTTQGPERVDVIYRRVDDDFLDPLAFRSDSTLGVAGLLSAYRAGNVTLANAIGTGIADDKSIYPYVPEMIEFYLGEKPILNNVPTFQCRKPEDLAYTLANLEKLVVKLTHGAGGYGMLVGPASTKAEIEHFRNYLIANPDRYIAQPTLALSTCPTFVESGVAPRHIDLRPFVLSGKTIKMVPGGLTRVALKEGSLVVNSSQGGGTKDTWVLEK